MKSLKRSTKREMLKERIKHLIAEEGLTAGEQILSQNQLAERFGVNPLTAHKALTELCVENILYRENGRGTFVGPKPTSTLNVALALPGEHLESAEKNPDFWPFVNHIMNIFIRTVGRSGCFSTISVGEHELETIDLNRFRQFDLVFSLGMPNFHLLAKRLAESETAVPVLFEAPIDGVDAIYIDNDRKESVKLGVSHLFMAGYEKIALFCTESDWGELNVEGYTAAHSDFGVPVDDNLIFRGFSLQKDGARAASMLTRRGMPCDAVFADTDLLALGMIEQFKNKGVDVPGEVGVMGYHGLELATSQPPFLTSVALPYEEMIRWTINVFNERKEKWSAVVKLDFLGSVSSGETIKKEANK
jgi:DNA-binding LacI/PurR family transcriptional regulator